jgi:CRISPR-associated endonuclease/helicase Cas3
MAPTPEKHGSCWAVNFLANKEVPLTDQIRQRCNYPAQMDRPYLDWVTALASDALPEGTSQLQTVRRDYLLGNLRSIMQRTTAEHLTRTLFVPWDYADALDNQSLHWEPSEDRRHAYQWHMPNGDPTRKRRGGMLGANRLALEAWPLFPSFPFGDRLGTRGFKGNRAADTFWTWPLWCHPLTKDGVTSILGLRCIQNGETELTDYYAYGLNAVFRVQRILVNKTPNFTTTMAIA